MKQIVPFTRTIDLDTSVEEITSISLDKKVNSINNGIISGIFDLFLEFKENEESIDNRKYSSQIPFDIDIDDKYILDSISLDIDDFYYELGNNKVILHIDILIDNLELNDRVVEENVLNEDNNTIRNDEEEPNLFSEIQKKVENVTVPIYKTFDSEKDSYVTYSVHIIRDDESIDTICQKYNVSKEDLAYYNDITTVKLGDKIIVPTYKK